MSHHLYNFDNFLTVLRSPSRLIGVYHLYATEANKWYYQWTENEGVDVMEEDWDTLLLLDGCRYDIFADQHGLPGKLSSRRSQGSDSHEFITANFSGQELHDTVYVTSNPYVSSVSDGTFHAIENVLKSGWDENLRTVPPKTMSAAIKSAHKKYPNKRIIGHFMQPHFPFIGPTGRAISHGGIPDRNVDSYHQEIIQEDGGDEELSIWYKLQFNLDGINKEQVEKSYSENLNLVLEEVDSLLKDIHGKIVVSADHGNLMGDYIGPIPCRGYGHPRRLHVDPLVTVPWLVINGERRREIYTDEPNKVERIDDDTLEDRLSALGYT